MRKSYAVHVDANIILVEGVKARKIVVIDAILELSEGKRVVVEHYSAPYRTHPDVRRPAPSILDRWHVFAHDGYHLIEVISL